MFQLDTPNPRVIYRRSTGRLMRPSDRMIATHGLGELDGILDTLKNFGSGVVKFATAGIYDPNKNRFYVPFSSGQMRNWAQGAVNTTTLGLVKTDKFFGSQTMRTIGTVAGAAAAAGAAYFGGQAIMKSFSSPTSTAPGAPGSPTFGPPSPTAGILANVSKFTPSLSTVKTALDVTKTVMGAGATASQPMLSPPGSGGGQIIIMNQPSGPMPQMYDPAQYMMSPGGGVMYPPSGGEMGFGPGMVFGGGGGGGIGPPGSEYMIDPVTGQPIPVEEMGMGMKLLLVAGVGVVAFVIFKE